MSLTVLRGLIHESHSAMREVMSSTTVYWSTPTLHQRMNLLQGKVVVGGKTW